METLESLKAKQAKETARLEAELHLAGLAPLVPDYIGLSRKGPAWIVYRGRIVEAKGWKHYQTVAQHLAMYGRSSEYKEI